MEHCQNVVVEQEYVSNLLVGSRLGPEVPMARRRQEGGWILAALGRLLGLSSRVAL